MHHTSTESISRECIHKCTCKENLSQEDVCESKRTVLLVKRRIEDVLSVEECSSIECKKRRSNSVTTLLVENEFPGVSDPICELCVEPFHHSSNNSRTWSSTMTSRSDRSVTELEMDPEEEQENVQWESLHDLFHTSLSNEAWSSGLSGSKNASQDSSDSKGELGINFMNYHLIH